MSETLFTLFYFYFLRLMRLFNLEKEAFSYITHICVVNIPQLICILEGHSGSMFYVTDITAPIHSIYLAFRSLYCIIHREEEFV